KAARAGVVKSKVSAYNRVLQRHEQPYGAYWKTYDFRSDEGRSDVVRYPLGPAYKGNPYRKWAFVHYESEILFDLPNGLHGYLLVDRRGWSIDEAPLEVVRDRTEAAGSAEVVNGLSCIACHRQGVFHGFKDVVRAGTPVRGRARAKVQRL